MHDGFTFETTWQSPSNIALVKYWGKHPIQIPMNPSISLTLSKAVTITKTVITFAEKPTLSFYFDGERKDDFLPKIQGFLGRIAPHFPWLQSVSIQIHSRNSFPHSAGIASSASAMSALALCLTETHEVLNAQNTLKADFYQKASEIARIGSGSASRSVYGAFALWGEQNDIPQSSNHFAVPIADSISDVFKDFRDDILIIDSKPKAVSSSQGHALMTNHPYRNARINQANNHINALMESLQTGDLKKFITITENEALSLHSLMMSSESSFTLLHPNTLIAIDKIRKYRKQTQLPVCFTLDAGPNIHLLYPGNIENQIKDFVFTELKPLCENGYILHDKIGEGAIKKESYHE